MRWVDIKDPHHTYPHHSTHWYQIRYESLKLMVRCLAEFAIHRTCRVSPHLAIRVSSSHQRRRSNAATPNSIGCRRPFRRGNSWGADPWRSKQDAFHSPCQYWNHDELPKSTVSLPPSCRLFHISTPRSRDTERGVKLVVRILLC